MRAAPAHPRLLARRATVGIAWGLALPALAGAQGSSTIDHSTPPTLGKPARLIVPSVAPWSLPNGVKLRIVEQHELPLVHVTAVIDGGALLDGDRSGMSTFVAGMLDEGAGTRDAAALQSELAYLGAALSSTASWDEFTISLKVPVRSLGPALNLMADVLLRPTLSAADVRRQRDLRLAALLQQRDQPNTLGSLALNQLVYPAGHPYHRPSGGDSASAAALDSASVRTFYERAFVPSRTTFIVVGDIGAAAARLAIQSIVGAWRPRHLAAPLPSITVSPNLLASTHVTFVDKTEAAQSVINIGWPGVDRHSPDYAAIMVMNTILGGSFTSRLNMNLREAKGYSYGARSGFTFRRTPGPFVASADVRTDVTDSSLVEFFKELRRLRDDRVSEEELARAKAYVELGLPGSLEGTSQVAGELADLLTFGLSLSDLPRFASKVRLVSAADVQRVAHTYLTPDKATVVVVGDLAKIRAGVDALKLGPSSVLQVKDVAR
jgi:predicted Zn-dependent peptidase